MQEKVKCDEKIEDNKTLLDDKMLLAHIEDIEGYGHIEIPMKLFVYDRAYHVLF